MFSFIKNIFSAPYKDIYIGTADAFSVKVCGNARDETPVVACVYKRVNKNGEIIGVFATYNGINFHFNKDAYIAEGKFIPITQIAWR